MIQVALVWKVGERPVGNCYARLPVAVTDQPQPG